MRFIVSLYMKDLLLFSALNLALVSFFPLTNALGESMHSRH